jgi:hypothetical protein
MENLVVGYFSRCAKTPLPRVNRDRRNRSGFCSRLSGRSRLWNLLMALVRSAGPRRFCGDLRHFASFITSIQPARMGALISDTAGSLFFTGVSVVKAIDVVGSGRAFPAVRIGCVVAYTGRGCRAWGCLGINRAVQADPLSLAGIVGRFPAKSSSSHIPPTTGGKQ